MFDSLHYNVQLRILRIVGSIDAALLVWFGLFWLKTAPCLECAVLFGLATLISWRVWSLSLQNNLHYVSLSVMCWHGLVCFLIFHFNHGAIFFLIYPTVMLSFFLCSKTAAILIDLPLIAIHCLLLDTTCPRSMQCGAVVSLLLSIGLGYLVAHYCRLTVRRMNHPSTLETSRQCLQETLADQLKSSDSDSQLNGLILIHLAGIDTTREQHGRKVSESMIRDIIAQIDATLKKAKRLFRLSTEEFVVLVHANHYQELSDIEESLRRDLCQMIGAPFGQYRVSIGAALFANETAWQDWFSRADAALFFAQRQVGSLHAN